MGQQVRAPGALQKGFRFGSRPHITAHNHLSLKFQGIWHFLALEDTRHICDAHTSYIGVGKTFIYIKLKYNLLKKQQ